MTSDRGMFRDVFQAGGQTQRRKLIAVFFVACMLLSSLVIMASPEFKVASDIDAEATEHKITYHKNDGTTATVKVNYYGIAATEYNPAYWTENLDAIYADKASDVIGSRSPWYGETVSVSIPITSVSVSQEYKVRLDSGTLYFSYDGDDHPEGHDLRLTLTAPKSEEVLRIVLENGVTPRGVIADPNKPSDIRPSSTEFDIWEDRFTYGPDNRFKLSYWSDKSYVYVKFQTLRSPDYLHDLTTGEYVDFGLLFDAVFNTERTISGVPVEKVFGGWSTTSNYDYSQYPEGIVYPGDVVPSSVTDLYAVWLYPDLKVPQATTTSSTDCSKGRPMTTTLTIDTSTLKDGITPYIPIDSLKVDNTDTAGVYHYDYVQNKYVPGVSESNYSMFSTIYQLKAEDNVTTISSTTTIPSGTYRSADGDIQTIGIWASLLMGGDVVMDNLRFRQLYYDPANRLANSSSFTINANYHRLIVGTNVDVDRSYIEERKESDESYKSEFLWAPFILGGYGNTTTPIQTGKSIVSVASDSASEENRKLGSLTVDIGTYVIVHSGIYAHISAGPTDYGVVGNESTPLSTYAVVKNATVMGIVGGASGFSKIYGSIYDDPESPYAGTTYDGGTFVYCVGLKSTGDKYEDLATGFDVDAHDLFNVDESSVVQGGSRTGKVYGSTHLFVSGKSSLFDAQAGGRIADSYCQHTYLEISGKATVRHVACGTITDGAATKNNYRSVDGVDIYISQSPTIAMLLGAGYDTWNTLDYSTMTKGDINIEITGGLIGYVYGGGMRGSIGTDNEGEQVDVNIKMTGGTVKYDLFGGGRGALDKVHHKAIMDGDAQPDGSLGRWDEGKNSPAMNSSSSIGYARIHGDVSIEISGGTVEGSVYGGGESIPATKNYLGVKTLSNPSATTVAAVTGDVTVTIKSGAEIKGDVFGAGKGITIENGAIVQPKVDVRTAAGYTGLSGIEKMPYYSAMMITTGDEDHPFTFIPWISGSNRQTSAGVGVVTYYVTQTDLDRYAQYAKVNGAVQVIVEGGTIGGSVYGGGEMGVTSYVGTATSVNVEGGTIGGSVYGGGFGTLDTVCVDGDSAAVISGGTIGGSVYGGSAYGMTDNTSVTITGLGNLAGDVYGGGLGVAGHVSVLSDSSVTIAGPSKNGLVTIKGTVYGGSAYGINNGDVTTILSNCKVQGNVYGGGLGTANNMSVKGKRTVKMLSGEITMNIFGGSSDGDDGIADTYTSDSVVMITSGTIGGSIYGGGLLGKTNGDTTIYIGYTTNEVGNYIPTPDMGANKPVIDIRNSVYAGGEVNVTGESSAAYTQYLVMGTGRVFVYAQYTDVTIVGSLMGSGNSCLTYGLTSLYTDHFDDPVEMAGIHRFDEVNLKTSYLEIGGRESTIGGDTKICSLSHIGSLTLTDMTNILVSNPVDDIGGFNSMNKDNMPTTYASPFNKVIFKAGSTLFIRSITEEEVAGVKTYETTYGIVRGYTVLSVMGGNTSYGGYVIGDENSTGGFMILKDGTFHMADKSKFKNSSIVCWFISGVESKTVALNLADGHTSQTATVDITKLQITSTMKYTGGMFVPSAEYTLGEDTSTLTFDLGFVDENDRSTALVYSSGGETPTYGLTFRASQSDDKNLLTGSISGGNFTPFVGDDRAGVFTLNLRLSGTPDGTTKYLGYLLIHLQEVNNISYDTPTEHEDEVMITNKVELKVDLYMVGTTISNHYDFDLGTVNGEGSVNMIFPDHHIKESIHLLSLTSTMQDAPAITLQPALNTGNTTGWLVADNPITLSTYNSETTEPRDDNLIEIGTLSGSYTASLRISISEPVPKDTQYHIRLVMKNQDGTFITEGGNIKIIQIIITVSPKSDVTVTFYDYMHGVKPSTKGIDKTFSYGTQLTDADCPAVSENFLGWYTDEEFVNIFNFSTPITKDMTLYARYSYAVTFDYQDGTYSKLYLASNLTGVTVTEPVEPVRVGYEFGGWYKQSKCIEEWDFENDTINNDITLYAKWSGEDILVLFKFSENDPPIEYIETTAGVITCPVVAYGGTFEVLDITYSASMGEDYTILDTAREMILADHPGLTFIRWQIKVEDQFIPIYEDTKINDEIINIETTPVSEQYHMKTIELIALTSPVAIQINMTPGVDDVSAVVSAPSSFLVYPYEHSSHTEDQKVYHTYRFKYVLNDATRSGYQLKYWHNPEVTVEPLYPTPGLERIVQIDAVEQGGHICVMKESLVVNGQLKEVRSYTGDLPWLDDSSESKIYKIQYDAIWELINYTIFISSPAHGYIDAYKVEVGTGNAVILTKGDKFTAHYGDRIKLVFTPIEDYQFYEWTYEGECLIEDKNKSVTTLVVTGDAVIQASDTGERSVMIYMSLNDTDETPDEIYLKKGNEYFAIEKNSVSDVDRRSLYMDYLVAGQYIVCIKDGEKYYEFGTVDVGEGQNIFYYEIFSLSIENITGDKAGAILDYSRYVGHPYDSNESVFASITISKGYTYELSEWCYGDDNVYRKMNDLGEEEHGTTRDVELAFIIDVVNLKKERFIEGEVNPVSYTIRFYIGDGTTYGGELMHWNKNGATNYSEYLERTYSYGQTFTNDTVAMPHMSDFETVAGSLTGYSLFHWYANYESLSDEFSSVVYEDTVLDSAFLGRPLSRVGNTITLYGWAVFNSADVTLNIDTYTQNIDGAGYTRISSSATPLISGADGSYMGVFTVRYMDGFTLNDGLTETEGMNLGSSVVKHEEDYLATIYTDLDEHGHSTVGIKLYYDRMTTVLELDTGGVAVDGWDYDDVTGRYTKTVRYGQTVTLPTDLSKTYYSFKDWLDESGEVVSGNQYTVTLSDVQAYEQTSDTVILEAEYEPINAYKITLLTSIGSFEDGSRRMTLYVTPDQSPVDEIKKPSYEGTDYQLADQPYEPAIPRTFTQDLTMVAQWTVTPHRLDLSVHGVDEGADHIRISGTYDSSEPFLVTNTQAYSGDLPHHSEITLTIRVDAGYDLNLEDTMSGVSGIGQPEELDGGRGYRWTFFLDSDVTILFHSKKATLDVHYLINGSLYQTDHVLKYAYETLITPDMTGYNWNGVWYTDRNCTQPYTLPTVQILADKTFYTKATASQYTVHYHSNNNEAADVTETFTYGKEKSLKSFASDPRFNQEGYIMVGWSNLPTDLVNKGELKYNLEETVINLSSDSSDVHLYAYYLKVEHSTNEAITYDGNEYWARITKSTGDPDIHNVVIYYSTIDLSSYNYVEYGSLEYPRFVDAGAHHTFYYGWVHSVDQNGDIVPEKRSYVWGYMETDIARKPVTLTSGSASRSFVPDTHIYNNRTPDGIEGFIEAERAGLSFIFDYNSTNGPTEVGSYMNTFRAEFDGIRIHATNYAVEYVPGTLTIAAPTSDSIVVELSQTYVYGTANQSLSATGGVFDYDVVHGDDIITLNNDNTINAIKVGSGTVRISIQGHPDEYVDVEVVVSQKPISVSVTITDDDADDSNNGTKMYDGTSDLRSGQHLQAVITSGLVDGDEDLVYVSPSGRYTDGHGNAATNASNELSIEIAYYVGGTKGSNYQVDLEHSTLSLPGVIEPREVIVTPDSASMVYSGEPLTCSGYTITGDGFINDNGFSAVVMSGSITDVGWTYNNVTSSVLNESTEANNYRLTYIDDVATLTVTVRSVDIPRDGISIRYSGLEIEAPIDSHTWYEVDEGSSTEYARDIGDYTVVLNLKGNDGVTVNVEWSDGTHGPKTINWHIIAAQLNYNRFTMMEGDLYYNGTPYDNMLTYVPSYTGIEYVPYDESTGIGDYRIVYPEDTVSAGDKTVTVVGMNGYVGSILEYNYTVLKRPLTVTIEQGQQFLYDGQAHSPLYIYTGLLMADIDTGKATFEMTNADKVNYTEGGYTSVLSLVGENAPNYEFQQITVNWSIEKRIAYITAQSDWDTLNDTALTNSTYSTVGILADDLAAFDISVAGSLSDVGIAVNVVTCDVLDPDKANNYEIHTINGTLIMTCSANDISFIESTVEATI